MTTQNTRVIVAVILALVVLAPHVVEARPPGWMVLCESLEECQGFWYNVRQMWYQWWW